MAKKSPHADTLNLPGTPFPMRGDLARREPLALALWEKHNLHNRLPTSRSRPPPLRPPRRAALRQRRHPTSDTPSTKCLKDFIVRAKNLAGYDAPYLPGWDCHGLPVERQVEQNKIARHADPDFRAQCRAFAEEQINRQRADFIRMGVMGEWDNPYKTMRPETEAGIIRALGRVRQAGIVVRQLRPSQWCPVCQSALAEAEVEYEERQSLAVDVAFNAVDERAVAKIFTPPPPPGKKSTAAVIWTTTAWTLPANRAICVHPEMRYDLVENETGARFIVAAELRDAACKRWGFQQCKVVAGADGKQLAGLVFRHPFYDRESPVLCGEHVTAEAGTGLVHTAPGHGEDDFRVGVANNLPAESPVDGRGFFADDLPLFGGMKVWDAVGNIADHLHRNGKLLARENYRHSYPLCWRHKAPILFRVTLQWFAAMDKPLAGRDETLRQLAMRAISETDFYPPWGRERMAAMVEQRPDWCLSRQRQWNTPMTFYLHRKTGELHPKTDELLERAAKVVERGGIEAWHAADIGELLGESCKGGGGGGKKDGAGGRG